MKIGIYVGSFNPIHLGHINVLNYLLDNNYLDKIFIVPTKNYWDKNNLVDINKRIDMLKYIENDNIIIDTINNKYDYTYQILDEYSKKYKDIYLIIGADNIVSFNEWKNIDDILKYNVIVLNRNNIDIKYYIDKYKFDINRFIILSDYPYIDISSSTIRNNIEDNKKYLDSRIYKYIINNNLYRR